MLLLTTHLYLAPLSAATVSPVRDPVFAEVLPDKSLKFVEPDSALCHWYVRDAPEPVDDAPLNVNVAAAVAATVTVRTTAAPPPPPSDASAILLSRCQRNLDHQIPE